MLRVVRLSILSALAALATASCGDPPTGGDTRVAATVRVSPDSVRIHIGDTLRLSVIATDSTGDTLTQRPVAWTSSDTSVVVVSPAGLVTARTHGLVTITATVDSTAGTAAVRVLVPVAQVELEPDSLTLIPGGSAQLSVIVTDADGNRLNDRPVAFHIDAAPLNVGVTSTGVLTATQIGHAEIEAYSEGVYSSTLIVDVVRLQGIIGVSAGPQSTHTCASASPRTFCWGSNRYGELGNGTVTDSGIAGASGLSFATGTRGPAWMHPIALGQNFTCAVLAQEVECWGTDDENRLGNGSAGDQDTPGLVVGAPAAAGVAAGDEHACLIGTDSLAYCWGAGNALQTPTLVSADLKFEYFMLVASLDRACALTYEGAAYCWAVASVGIGTPTLVPGGHTFIWLVLGGQHACGITDQLETYCWGQNASGQLGDSSTTFRSQPVLVAGGHQFLAITAGEAFTCGGVASGDVYCWGNNDYGQLGSQGPGSNVPIPVSGGLTFQTITAGAHHVCGLSGRTSPVAYCWGSNAFGQLGDGTKIDRFAPVRVAGQP